MIIMYTPAPIPGASIFVGTAISQLKGVGAELRIDIQGLTALYPDIAGRYLLVRKLEYTDNLCSLIDSVQLAEVVLEFRAKQLQE